MFAAFSNGAWTNEAWTAALVNHLWQSTVVVVMAWFLTLILRNNHAGARYWVWMIASVKFVIPFAPLIPKRKEASPQCDKSLQYEP